MVLFLLVDFVSGYASEESKLNTAGERILLFKWLSLSDGSVVYQEFQILERLPLWLF